MKSVEEFEEQRVKEMFVKLVIALHKKKKNCRCTLQKKRENNELLRVNQRKLVLFLYRVQ